MKITSSLFDYYNEILTVKRDSIKSLYLDCSLQTERGEVERGIWELILTYGYDSKTSINIEDSTAIAEYANLCMSDYGQSIGYIRSLYEYLFGVYIDDEDICGSEESRLGNITQQDIDVKLKFDLIPNLANISVTIRLTHDRKGPFNVKVLSTQGQILLNEQKSTKEFLLNIGEFGPGIYIVKISDEKQESFRKLVILK